MLAPAARAGCRAARAYPQAEGVPAKWTPNQALAAPEAAPPPAARPPTLARWFTPTFDLRQSYSDNVALRPDGGERGSLVTELVPGLRVRHKGPRVAFNGQYEFHYYKMSQDVPGTRQSSRVLRADGKAALVDDLFYMDGNAAIQNQAISAFAQNTNGNDYADANRTEVRSWRLSPYLVHRFGSFATGELRYTRDSVDA
ncbi:TIGR03016 family PEP-CTERM system-associated outer membrane protein [Massilia sp. H-1]|nr:TIGR03016 family PEP-CTERM system-associated outer membrane protein [Massilia sp. H-1]